MMDFPVFIRMALWSVLLGACSRHKEIVIEQPVLKKERKKVEAEKSTDQWPTEGPTAYAVSIDITPPPGLPMGGFSVMANWGEGFRTRLKARVIYLNDGQGQKMALVQTDLTSGSLLVHHAVAKEVAAETELSPADIAMTASHTHSAPVNFFENNFYNKHMSSGKGFEEKYFKFIVERITQGILEAYRKQRPAKIATGQREVYGINRNRSIRAYALNKNVDSQLLEEEDAVFKAVDPFLNMIRVDILNDAQQYVPVGAFSTFAVHATTMSPRVEVYNGDLFAYAQKDLEWAIRDQHQTPWPVVHALTSGASGDMAPALPDHEDRLFRKQPVNWEKSRLVGQKLGQEAIALFKDLGTKLTRDFQLETAAKEINIREQHDLGDVAICRDAAVGNPLVGGAFENRMVVLSALPIFKGGNIMSRRWWFFKDGCQGNKRHVGFSFLQPLLEPKDSFPQTVWFQLMRIHDTVVLPVPFEVTAEAGRRMSAAVLQEFENEDVKHAWVANLGNGFFGYATTPEEYARQNYEGGHTIYGKNTTPYLTTQLARLAANRHNLKVPKMLPEWRYTVKLNQFMPDPSSFAGLKEKARSWFRQPYFGQAETSEEEIYVAVEWQGVSPDKIEFHLPLVRVEQKTEQDWQPLVHEGIPISDEGYDIEVRYLGLQDDQPTYQVRWYRPIKGTGFRFALEPRGTSANLLSPSFEWNGEKVCLPTCG